MRTSSAPRIHFPALCDRVARARAFGVASWSNHMTRRFVPFAAAAAAVLLLAGGCSDDVVCPEGVQDGVVPHISAHVMQGSDGRAEWTHAEVVCSADPLPSILIAFVNGRELSGVGTSGDLALVRFFDQDVIVWQPGSVCSLEVTSDYGYATAAAAVPEAPLVSAPAALTIGDTLRLHWPAATGADYYRVMGTFTDSPVSADRGDRETLAFLTTTRDTAAAFTTDSIASPGEFVGVVEAVAGPFPQGGTEGNISGDGWGFFTLRYSDAGSAFTVALSDPRAPRGD